MKTWEKFYECDCGAEAVALSREVGEDGYIYMAFFNQGLYSINALTFKERIRAIWQIITKGTVWNDMVILKPNTAKELGKDLLKWGEKYEKTTMG